jgi:hypothetical protein
VIFKILFHSISLCDIFEIQLVQGAQQVQGDFRRAKGDNAAEALLFRYFSELNHAWRAPFG